MSPSCLPALALYSMGFRTISHVSNPKSFFPLFIFETRSHCVVLGVLELFT